MPSLSKHSHLLKNAGRSSAERRLRAGLPFIRWMTAYLPVSAIRWLMRLGERAARVPESVRREAAMVGGVPCEWLIPEGCDERATLLYLHGGGFVYGWSQMHRGMVAELARRCGISALAVEYRLAPEHPFPAALHDCAAVYRSLIEQLGREPSRIVIAGDSAGGNLTLSTIVAAREAGLAVPAAAVCLSPVTDFDKEEQIRRGGVDDALLHPRALRRFRDAYVADHAADDPMLSPAHADLRGFPPLLVQAGGGEFFLPDAKNLAEAARKAGVPVELQVFPEMWHVWQVFAGQLPQADDALERMVNFIRARLAST